MHEKDVQTAAKLFPLIFPREMRNSKFDIPLCSYVIEYTKLGTILVPFGTTSTIATQSGAAYISLQFSELFH